MDHSLDLDQTQAIVVDDLDDDDLTDEIASDGEKQPCAYLKVPLQNGLSESSYPLYEGDNIIGRQSDTCHVCIPSKSLSKEHACVQIAADSHLICDKKSRNKTRRGKLILKPEVWYEVKHGDEVMFADVKCIYEIRDQMTEIVAETDSETDASESLLLEHDAPGDHSAELADDKSGGSNVVCPNKEIGVSDFPQTLVLSESESEDDDVQISGAGIIQETVVVENSDEDSSEYFMDVATQAYTETGRKRNTEKSNELSERKQKLLKSSLKSVEHLPETQSFQIGGSCSKRGAESSAKEKAKNTSQNSAADPNMKTKQAFDGNDNDESSDDAVELFAVSTMACNFGDDIVEESDDNVVSNGPFKTVDHKSPAKKAVADSDEASSSETVDVNSDATMAVEEHVKDVSEKAKTSKLAYRASDKVSGKEKCDAEGSDDDDSTQNVDETVAIDKITEKKAGQPKRRDHVVGDISDGATVSIESTVPAFTQQSSPRKRRSKAARKVFYDEPTQAFDDAAHEHSHSHHISKPLNMKKCEKASPEHTEEDPVEENDGLGGGSCENNRDDGDTQLCGSESCHSAVDVTEDQDATQEFEHATEESASCPGLGKPETCRNEDPTLRCDSEVEEKPDKGSHASPAVGVRARLDSSDDSDLEKESVLKPDVLEDPSHLFESGGNASTVSSVNIEPTVAYDMAVNVNSTLAYDMAVEEKPQKSRKSGKSKSRKPGGNKSDDTDEKPGSDDKLSDSVICGSDVHLPAAPLPSKSPLKSALVDRRRSPSPANRRVAFAESSKDGREGEDNSQSKSVEAAESPASKLSEDSGGVTSSNIRRRSAKRAEVVSEVTSGRRVVSRRSRGGKELKDIGSMGESSTDKKVEQKISEQVENKDSDLDSHDQICSVSAESTVSESSQRAGRRKGKASHTLAQDDGENDHTGAVVKPKSLAKRRRTNKEDEQRADSHGSEREEVVAEVEQALSKRGRRSLPVNAQDKKPTDVTGTRSGGTRQNSRISDTPQVIVSVSDNKRKRAGGGGRSKPNSRETVAPTSSESKEGEIISDNTVSESNEAEIISNKTVSGRGRRKTRNGLSPGAAAQGLDRSLAPLPSEEGMSTQAAGEDTVEKGSVDKICEGPEPETPAENDSKTETRHRKSDAKYSTRKRGKRSVASGKIEENGQEQSLAAESSQDGSQSFNNADSGTRKNRKSPVVSLSSDIPTEENQTLGKLKPGKRGRKSAPTQVRLNSATESSGSQSATIPSSSQISTTSPTEGPTLASTKHQSSRNKGKKSEVAECEVRNNDNMDDQHLVKLSRKRGRSEAAFSQGSSQQDIGTQNGTSIQASPSSAKKSRLMPSPKTPTGNACLKNASSSALRKSSMGAKPRVMFTGFVDENAEKVVRDLGGEVPDSIQDCTHLVTDRICRTVKFLSGLAKGLLIVSRQWLDSCKRAGTFVDGHKFLVSDPAMEKQYKFSLATSISKAQSCPLLAGYKVHVSKSVKPDPVQMQDILKCAGAQYLGTLPSRAQDKTVVISCAEDQKLCQQAIKVGIPVVSAEFILTGILRQELDFKSFSLFSAESTQQTSEKGRAKRSK